MKRLLFSFLLVLPGLNGWCQGNPGQASLTWNYTRLYNGRNQEELTTAGQLVSYPAQKIDWVQNNGAYTDSYTITGVSGSWGDVSATGSITFLVQWGTSTGTFVFTRDANGLVGELTLANPNRPGSYFKFYIASVSPN